MRRAVSRDLMYPQTMGAMSRLSFMKPASKSGASYGSADLMWVEPREKGYLLQCQSICNLASVT